MRVMNWFIALAVCAFGVATTASAQEVRQPLSISPIVFEYGYYDEAEAEDETEASPSDRIVIDEPAVVPAAAVKGDDAKQKGRGCGRDGKGCGDSKGGKGGKVRGWGLGLTSLGSCMCQGCPWELMTPTYRGLDIGGWGQFAYHTNGNGAANSGDYLFNNYPNRLQAQQLWLYIDKAADTGGCGWAYGYHMDLVYGTDGQDTQAFGSRPNTWDNPWDYGLAYGSAIPQMYVDVAYNDLTLRMGKFYTIMGYEVVQAPDNWFYSKAWTMVRAEPFTHTGLLAEYAWGDNITLWGGWTAGWDTGFNANGGSTFLGGFSADLTDSMALTWTISWGDFGFNTPGPTQGSDADGLASSVVFEWGITDRLTYVFQTDYIDNDILATSVDQIWGVNQYLLYQINDCVGTGMRFEHFNDPRLGGHVNTVTANVNMKLHPNVIFRPELKWDTFDPATGLPHQTTFGADVIFTF